MFQNIKQLYGKKLSASDGTIGHVQDFYFDDKTWALRYMVVDTGSWLSGRQVLLSSHAFSNHAFGQTDTGDDLLLVNLTRKQIENSPSIESHRPVSRQHEEDYYRYYGWPIYWQDGAMTGMIPLPPQEDVARHGHSERNDTHLRSTMAITGYHIQATDGPIGSVSGFMADGRTWTIREVVVEIGHWYAGKEILLLPENIERINYEQSKVFMNLSKETIQQTMSNDVAQSAGN